MGGSIVEGRKMRLKEMETESVGCREEDEDEWKDDKNVGGDHKEGADVGDVAVDYTAGGVGCLSGEGITSKEVCLVG